MNEKISKTTFIAKYFSNPRLVLLILVLVLGIGINSFLVLPRTLNPQINIPIVLVSTVLPGSNPGDIESLVTIPIEDAVNSVDNVKEITSTSRESVSLVSIEFESGTDPDKARTDVSSAVDFVTLPEDANDPNIQKLDFENQPVWTFALTGSDDASLFRFARDLRDKLEDLSEVDEVTLSGIEETEIEVTVKPHVVSTYGINAIVISQQIKMALSSFPAGTVRVGESNFSLTIDPLIVKVSDIRNLKVNIGGQILSLSDIATVSEHPKPDQAKSYLTRKDEETKRSVTFDIFKAGSSDIDDSVNAAERLTDDEIKKGKDNFKIETLVNTSEQIDEEYIELQRDFILIVLLVVLVLFVFLGARQAIVSALSAPLSFLIAFSVMRATGITLNFLSLFSLLLSLGLLVDDTVVVISAMTSYYRKYKRSPLETGLLVWRDFLIPIFTTTITTVWAFLPLLLSTGIIGEFIKSIPVVVSTALIGSFLVSIFIILPLIIFLFQGGLPRRIIILVRILFFLGLVGGFYLLIPKDNNLVLLQILALLVFLFIVVIIKNTLIFSFKSFFGKGIKFNYRKVIDEGFISFEKIDRRYRNIIKKIVETTSYRRRAVAAVLIFSVFSFALLPLGLVQNEFFPRTDEDYLYLSLELPSGTYIDKTTSEAKLLIEDLKQTDNVKLLTADVGRGFSAEQGIGSSGSENVLFSLVLDKDRNRSSGDIAQDLREKFVNYQKGELSVQEISGGPPAGADLQIRLLGNDLNTLDSYALKVEDFLKKQPGINNVEKSVKTGTSKLVFVPNQAEISRNQTSTAQIGLVLRTYASGINIDSNKFEGDSEDKDITLRFNSKSATVNELDTLMISTQNGNLPILALGELKLLPNPTLISREGGNRLISVSASVSKDFNIQEKNKDLESFADGELGLPEGYSWETGGVNEENEQSVQSILQAMVLSFFLIIVTMVVQFSSFRRAVIVMLVIPLSVSGVFIVFALTKIPLSFPALIGILALFGIVVKNSILIVDKIVKNEQTGMKLSDAIADASASRLEPIALTSLCTIIGLIPITLSNPLWLGLGGAIIAGLTFSGTIMLFFIPVVYYLLFKGSEKKTAAKH